MRHLLLAPALLLLLPAGAALARVDAGDVATSAGVSASLYSTFKDDKRIIPARDELSAFVASGGAIRGAGPFAGAPAKGPAQANIHPQPSMRMVALTKRCSSCSISRKLSRIPLICSRAARCACSGNCSITA